MIASPIVRARRAQPPFDEIVRRIAGAVDPERIWLFGSWARNEANLDSDVDIMIEMTSDLPRPRRAMLIDALFPDRDWPMDIWVYTPEEVAERRDRVGTLVHSILSEARLLYERQH